MPLSLVPLRLLDSMLKTRPWHLDSGTADALMTCIQSRLRGQKRLPLALRDPARYRRRMQARQLEPATPVSGGTPTVVPGKDPHPDTAVPEPRLAARPPRAMPTLELYIERILQLHARHGVPLSWRVYALLVEHFALLDTADAWQRAGVLLGEMYRLYVRYEWDEAPTMGVSPVRCYGAWPVARTLLSLGDATCAALVTLEASSSEACASIATLAVRWLLELPDGPSMHAQPAAQKAVRTAVADALDNPSMIGPADGIACDPSVSRPAPPMWARMLSTSAPSLPGPSPAQLALGDFFVALRTAAASPSHGRSRQERAIVALSAAANAVIDHRLAFAHSGSGLDASTVDSLLDWLMPLFGPDRAAVAHRGSGADASVQSDAQSRCELPVAPGAGITTASADIDAVLLAVHGTLRTSIQTPSSASLRHIGAPVLGLAARLATLGGIERGDACDAQRLRRHKLVSGMLHALGLPPSSATTLQLVARCRALVAAATTADDTANVLTRQAASRSAAALVSAASTTVVRTDATAAAAAAQRAADVPASQAPPSAPFIDLRRLWSRLPSVLSVLPQNAARPSTADSAPTPSTAAQTAEVPQLRRAAKAHLTEAVASLRAAQALGAAIDPALERVLIRALVRPTHRALLLDCVLDAPKNAWPLSPCAPMPVTDAAVEAAAWRARSRLLLRVLHLHIAAGSADEYGVEMDDRTRRALCLLDAAVDRADAAFGLRTDAVPSGAGRMQNAAPTVADSAADTALGVLLSAYGDRDAVQDVLAVHAALALSAAAHADGIVCEADLERVAHSLWYAPSVGPRWRACCSADLLSACTCCTRAGRPRARVCSAQGGMRTSRCVGERARSAAAVSAGAGAAPVQLTTRCCAAHRNRTWQTHSGASSGAAFVYHLR